MQLVSLLFMASFSIFHSSAFQPVCKSFWFSNRPSQDCSSMGLQEAPPLLANVLSLTLTNNSIVRIAELPADYRRLQSIRLDQCELEKIEYEALAQFDQLRELDLSRNKLTKLILPRNLATLRILNLSFNSFTYVPDMSHLENLRLVDLSHNQLISVRPRMLPFNLEVIRLSANRFTHLTPWPFLNKLQELDVSFNDLQCDCSLWQFVNWAEQLSLFDSALLPCRTPSELRKSPIDGKTVCGPSVISSTPESTIVSLGDNHQMCCTALATPAPFLYWQFNDKNISKGLSQKHLTDAGRVEFCLELRRITLKDVGRYKCVASLAGLNATRQFTVERDKIPIMLNSAEGIMIYCQFTICTFIGVCCIVSCCVLRTSGKRTKTRPKREYSTSKVLELPRGSTCEYCDVLEPQKDYDNWGDAETTAVRQYLQWRQLHLDRTSLHGQLKPESLCRLSRECNNLEECEERAPLAHFDDTSSYIERSIL
ncbi:unnamed protein product [Caenorhabditis bovis]|uniref:Ig-like domain-containing protein n=1 Tax=Caenorhabditis bovis TaxID=2654633 RepID=A0A8S1F4R9_9PELO|nr:unnamed protein product [Caenorhabditis bovis]